MAKREQIEQKLEQLILPVLEANKFELVDVEYVKEVGQWYLRAYIDKEGGITIDDCELVSRALNDKLDEENFIEEAYTFEVSSPGLTRPLKKDKDYDRNIGKPIEFRLFKAVNGSREWEGILKAYTKEMITVELEGKDVEIERSNLAMIRQAFVM